MMKYVTNHKIEDTHCSPFCEQILTTWKGEGNSFYNRCLRGKIVSGGRLQTATPPNETTTCGRIPAAFSQNTPNNARTNAGTFLFTPAVPENRPNSVPAKNTVGLFPGNPSVSGKSTREFESSTREFFSNSRVLETSLRVFAETFCLSFFYSNIQTS
jgi:hypothetical protein